MRNALILLVRVNCCNHFGKNFGISTKGEDELIQQNHNLPRETLEYVGDKLKGIYCTSDFEKYR